eukprot:TRINITY_DN2444_c0_g1_i6.p1 TRINITY_DN2444_c0_g1~~TRINITY_DN2444_c0_g1_i6.p1  ORF type:complete len:356 (-),score=72.26 TRINITY_DN2444_c0_g1_i6:145-1212(-)
MEYVHFTCTSEDINNISHALMMHDASQTVLLKSLHNVQDKLVQVAHNHAKSPMLSHTHGQPASPSTLGKELANFAYRINTQYELLKKHKFTAKLNGAVGNFNAHLLAYPEHDWARLTREFITGLGLEFNPYTTQIEPHDSLSRYLNNLGLVNTIMIGLNRDIWGYISMGYLKQKVKKNEVGSSVMPHKVNPIDFENSEGNLGMANSIIYHLVAKLPISRFQRDLSDSTVLRNNGTALGYSVLAYKSLFKGLEKVDYDERRSLEDLEDHWEVLAEAIQTVARKHGIKNAYEDLKDLTRGKNISKEDIKKYIAGLKIPAEDLQRLKNLEPKTYLGNAAEMADVKKFFNHKQAPSNHE